MEKAQYKSIQFHFFTGTGNSGKVCEWIAATAKEKGIETASYKITEPFMPIESPPQDALIVFASPTHGFNYPPIMVKYLLNFPKGKNHIALINTRAGMLIGNFVTPGLSGIALYLAAFILWLKGYKVRAMYPVDLPSNWISIHPGLNMSTIKKLHIINKARVNKMSEKLLNGDSNYRALFDVVQDILISPISLLYYLMGRFLLAKTFYASANCTNCGLCYKKCPVQAIKLINNRPFWTIHCESCMRCMGNCPENAIETSHGFTFAFFYLIYATLIVWFYTLIDMTGIQIQYYWLKMGLEFTIGITFFSVAYYAMHYLMLNKWVQKLMVYTSLTHFNFWGRRYKALKDKDFE